MSAHIKRYHFSNLSRPQFVNHFKNKGSFKREHLELLKIISARSKQDIQNYIMMSEQTRLIGKRTYKSTLGYLELRGKSLQ